MKHEINHQIGVKASPKEVFKALTEIKKLAQWWTKTEGSGSKVGDNLAFWFGDFCQNFKVTALKPGKVVKWKGTKDGMDEWAGTEVRFTISTDEGQTLILFTHAGWRRKTEMLTHCSMKWAVFMLSLKDLLEKGKGRPVPRDIPINHY